MHDDRTAKFAEGTTKALNDLVNIAKASAEQATLKKGKTVKGSTPQCTEVMQLCSKDTLNVLMATDIEVERIVQVKVPCKPVGSPSKKGGPTVYEPAVAGYSQAASYTKALLGYKVFLTISATKVYFTVRLAFVHVTGVDKKKELEGCQERGAAVPVASLGAIGSYVSSSDSEEDLRSAASASPPAVKVTTTKRKPSTVQLLSSSDDDSSDDGGATAPAPAPAAGKSRAAKRTRA